MPDREEIHEINSSRKINIQGNSYYPDNQMSIELPAVNINKSGEYIKLINCRGK